MSTGAFMRAVATCILQAYILRYYCIYPVGLHLLQVLLRMYIQYACMTIYTNVTLPSILVELMNVLLS